MIESLHQIDFIHSSGTLRLLDAGAIVDSAPKLAVKQGGERYSGIGAEWGKARAKGAAETTVTWSAVRDHASHAALHAFCIRHAAVFPTGLTGTLRVTISGGETWDIADAVVVSTDPLPLESSGTFETITSYSVTGGRMLPSSTLTLFAGIPWDWINQAWEDVSTTWENL